MGRERGILRRQRRCCCQTKMVPTWPLKSLNSSSNRSELQKQREAGPFAKFSASFKHKEGEAKDRAQ